MTRELLEQLEVREAEPHDDNLTQDLVVVGPVYGFGFVQHKLVGADKLHGTLVFRNCISHNSRSYSAASICSGVEASLTPVRRSSCPGQKRDPKAS